MGSRLLMCRLCSTQGDSDGGIMAFSDEGLLRCVQQHIKKYLYITIAMDDKFTKFICTGCLDALEGFHQFASMATQTQKKFIQATKVEEMNHGLLHTYLTKESKKAKKSKESKDVGVINDHDYTTSGKLGQDVKHTSRKKSRRTRTTRRKTRRRKAKPKVDMELIRSNDASDSNTHETLEIIVDPSLYLESSCDSMWNENNNDVTNMDEAAFTNVDAREETECPCPICGRTEFTDLKLHLRIHRPKGKHECNICKRVFKSSANLVQHTIYHDGGRFKCETCQRMYPTQSTLKAHAVSHSDLRPHQCQLCQKSFKRNQDLKFHMNQHTGERPYKCIYCEKAFASSGNCFSHRKRMHPDEVERDRKFAAKICR